MRLQTNPWISERHPGLVVTGLPLVGLLGGVLLLHAGGYSLAMAGFALLLAAFVGAGKFAAP
jgi:hypothetical protein